MQDDLTLAEALDFALLQDFPAAIDILVKESADAAQTIREAIPSFYTRSDLGFYWNPAREQAGIMPRPLIDSEFQDGISILQEKFGADSVRTEPLTPTDLQDWWVKVAYSPLLRRMGEIAQFHPSNDIPGFGGRPIASTIASGLLGAGLGYGAGWLGEKLLPSWARREGTLPNRLALIGGLGGATLGAVPGFINWHDGRDFNDNTLWNSLPQDGWEMDLGRNVKQAIDYTVKKYAFDNSGTIGGPSFEEMPLIQTDSLGRVLWQTGANPQTAAMTMGMVYGANQMPDPMSRPGLVTPHQTGLLGMAMGAAGGGVKGYILGRAVGAGLGLLTGMPQETQQVLGQSGAALGIVNSLMNRFYN